MFRARALVTVFLKRQFVKNLPLLWRDVRSKMYAVKETQTPSSSGEATATCPWDVRKWHLQSPFFPHTLVLPSTKKSSHSLSAEDIITTQVLFVSVCPSVGTSGNCRSHAGQDILLFLEITLRSAVSVRRNVSFLSFYNKLSPDYSHPTSNFFLETSRALWVKDLCHFEEKIRAVATHALRETNALTVYSAETTFSLNLVE